MTRAPWSARLAVLGSCATTAALTTVLLAAPAHAAPGTACPTLAGFTLFQDPGTWPPGLFAEWDHNDDGYLCVRPMKAGFLFIDNNVRG